MNRTGPSIRPIRTLQLLAAVVLVLATTHAAAAAGQSKCGGLAPAGSSTGGAFFDNDLPAGQDVFSFCAFGYPPHCWVGVNPIAGTWKIVNQYCFNPKWTNKYETVCPRGQRPGTWKGTGKMPFDYKGKPGAPDGLEECQHLMEE
jgi:hypothetical protein